MSDQITFQYNFIKYTKNNFGSHSIKQIRIKCENIDNASVEENNFKTTDISNTDLFLNEQFCVMNHLHSFHFHRQSLEHF